MKVKVTAPLKDVSGETLIMQTHEGKKTDCTVQNAIYELGFANDPTILKKDYRAISKKLFKVDKDGSVDLNRSDINLITEWGDKFFAPAFANAIEDACDEKDQGSAS